MKEAKGENFLARWSRLKAETREEPDQEPFAEADANPQEPVEASVRTPDPEPEPHPAERIDIESLTFESDFTVFMQKGVPDDVKRKALDKLWTSDPVLANLDGLTDYDLDLSPHGHGPFNGTSWRIGEGFAWLDAIEKLTEEKAPEEGKAAPETPVARDDAPAPEENDRATQDSAAVSEQAATPLSKAANLAEADLSSEEKTR